MKKAKIKTRDIQNFNYSSNKDFDISSNSISYFKNIIGECSADGVPSRVNFYITKNKNLNLTDKNEVVQLTIPIIPVCYDLTSKESLDDMLENGDSREKIADKCKSLEPSVFDKRIDEYALEIINYIKAEIALRYIEALKAGNSQHMQILAKLDIMKGFKFKLAKAIEDKPLRLAKRYSAPGYDSSLVYEDGTEIPVSDELVKLIPQYCELLSSHATIKDKYANANKILNKFETFAFENEEQPLPPT